MNEIVLRVKRYLKDNIDAQITIKDLDYMDKIPIFLRGIYKFYTMKILGVKCFSLTPIILCLLSLDLSELVQPLKRLLFFLVAQ